MCRSEDASVGFGGGLKALCLALVSTLIRSMLIKASLHVLPRPNRPRATKLFRGGGPPQKQSIPKKQNPWIFFWEAKTKMHTGSVLNHPRSPQNSFYVASPSHQSRLGKISPEAKCSLEKMSLAGRSRHDFLQKNTHRWGRNFGLEFFFSLCHWLSFAFLFIYFVNNTRSFV